MLKFTTPQQIAENTIIDQIILEAASGGQTISVNQFKGAVVVDPNLGNYVVIDFTVTDTAAMNIGRIRLMSGQKPVAISEDGRLLIVKEDHKNLKIRLAAQFAGAENCKFNTTSVNLPYATPFREGVVRFNNGDEINKSGTVYSAADVDAKIDAVTESLGNLDQYAKKATENTFTENNTFTKNVIVHGEISGEAVATLGMNKNATDAMVVSVGFANNKYLSKTEASSTYLTQANASSTYLSKTDAADTYLTKADANKAAENYAKLDGGNTFTGAKNTFQEVNATKFSGDGVVKSITDNTQDNAELIPTDGAVKTYVDGKITDLHNKDFELQSQIDGINAGQNLADIVDTTEALAAYDVAHLKAKYDFQHGESGAKWAIGDKVQVLGGADVQSSVYELIKGKKPEAESNSIQSTKNANYYWSYIGVYGISAYTKAEIDDKVAGINTAISTKADTSYVNTELAKKVDKTQIKTTISGDTATDTNIPSASAVKTYVDGKVGDINTALGNYVTIGDAQEITGAKTFANGNITIANPNTGHKDKHYVWVNASGDNTTGDYTSSVTHWDLTHKDAASDQFMRPRGDGDNVFHTNDLTRLSPDGKVQQYTKLEQHISNRYNYKASDMYMTTSLVDMTVAQIGTPGNTGSTDTSLTENYVERIRLRKNTSTATSTEGGFLAAGESVTDIDLFADNINNVFNNEVSFRVCTTAGEGAKTDTPVLEIRGSGVYYHTQEGNSISTTEYQLRTAGSLDFETSITQNADDSHLPTSLAVKNYVATTVDAKITELQGGMSYLKLTSTEKQTVASSVDFNGTIGGNAVAKQALDPQGTRLPTESAVVSFVNGNRDAIAIPESVGAMGLFLYTGGDFKSMSDEVDGTSLKAVGMQLPMDGVVSWSQGAAMPAGSKWKLLNNTIAGEPCLVLAICTAAAN